MAGNKRRKLNPLAGSRNLSAVAARKQLQDVHYSHESGSQTTASTYELPVDSEQRYLFNSSSILSSSISIQKFERDNGQELEHSSEASGAEAGNISDGDEEDDRVTEITSNGKSREAWHLNPSEQSWTYLTTVNLSKGNAEQLKDGSLRIRIGPGEKLVVLGQFGLSVVRGQVTVLGAVLSASQTIYDVCASSSHSLPVVRFLSSDTEKAEVLLYESKSKLRSLRLLSPLFAGIWSTSSSHIGSFDMTEPKYLRPKGRSFEIVLSRDRNSRVGCYPTVSPPEWNELLSKSASERLKDGKASITLVCGPKSSGKSTFSKLLINRLLTFSQAQGTGFAVAFLDLDPGQPEYSPPGQLSLILLSHPNLGPPFSHPDSSKNGTKLIRAHSISAVSPSSDPDFYMDCAADLFSCYLKLLSPKKSSLVINTPGWILGTGLELLNSLIKEVQPTQVIYMSQDGPHEVVESLQTAARSIQILTLPSQPTENLPRTSAHLRTMQYISYFHLNRASSGKWAWNSNPITSMAPLEVKYAGKAAGILGIMCLGEQPSTKMLRDTIDGSLLAVVIIEDMAAILGLKDNEDTEETISGNSGKDGTIFISSNDDESVKLPSIEQSPQQLESPAILHTPEGIPYFNPAKKLSLDPSCSHTIGLAMVRGIDVRQQKFQLLTPIPTNTIKEIRAAGKAIILVSGKLDTPGWAYLEALYKNDMEVKEDDRLQETDKMTRDSTDVEEDDEVVNDRRGQNRGFEDAPWIEALQGDKGREVGARVWRVRRDLGKTT